MEKLLKETIETARRRKLVGERHFERVKCRYDGTGEGNRLSYRCTVVLQDVAISSGWSLSIQIGFLVSLSLSGSLHLLCVAVTTLSH